MCPDRSNTQGAGPDVMALESSLIDRRKAASMLRVDALRDCATPKHRAVIAPMPTHLWLGYHGAKRCLSRPPPRATPPQQRLAAESDSRLQRPRPKLAKGQTPRPPRPTSLTRKTAVQPRAPWALMVSGNNRKRRLRRSDDAAARTTSGRRDEPVSGDPNVAATRLAGGFRPFLFKRRACTLRPGQVSVDASGGLTASAGFDSW